MIRVADLVAQILAENEIKDVFMLTGGGAMHLNDAFGKHTDLNYICCHHEQSLAMAAESYFRLSGKLACVNVTTGPGGINALNGVFGAYTDSCGMVVISGQVKRETMSTYLDFPLRQLGDQEARIMDIVKPMTKFAAVLDDPQNTRYLIEKAIYMARSGRPGPVWVDVPIDVQGALVDEKSLKSFIPEKEPTITEGFGALTGEELKKQVQSILEHIKKAERPVIMVGGGLRISGSYNIFHKVIDQLQVPVVTAFNAHDVIWNDHPLYVGRPGTVGDRPGNFAVQNADFLLVLGCRLNIRQISYNWKSFARHATVCMVDIDTAELKKPTLSIDIPVHADLKEFLTETFDQVGTYAPSERHQTYMDWCKERQRRYPVVLSEYYEEKGEGINPYVFVNELFKYLEEDDVIVTGDGTAIVATFQAAFLKRHQRLYSNSGCASMGYDLPAAMGAYYALKPKRIICIAGDGSIMMNIQELAQIAGHQLPIKIFLLNNEGYHSIRQTQETFFKDNIVGCGADGRLIFPNFQKISQAFGIKCSAIKRTEEIQKTFLEALHSRGPKLCEVIINKSQQFSPKLSSRKLEDGTMVTSPLEDMAPFLERDELFINMFINDEGEI